MKFEIFKSNSHSDLQTKMNAFVEKNEIVVEGIDYAISSHIIGSTANRHEVVFSCIMSYSNKLRRTVRPM